MSNDLISQAESLIEKHTTSGYIHRDATLLLPGLVEEITRLQSDNDFLHKFVDDPGSTLEAALNAVREQSEVIRKQQAASAATLTKWQQVAIEATAKAAYCNDNWNGDTKSPADEDFWRDSEDEATKATYREQAAKELGLQLDDTGEELTIAYMLGSKKANDRLKVLQKYVRRLEPKYIDSNAARRYYADGYEAPWPQVGNEFKERYIKDALAALEKIRRG